MNGQHEPCADFFDDDEPVEMIRAAFRRPQRPVVTRPSNLMEETIVVASNSDGLSRWVVRVRTESNVKMDGVTWGLNSSSSGRSSFTTS